MIFRFYSGTRNSCFFLTMSTKKGISLVKIATYGGTRLQLPVPLVNTSIRPTTFCIGFQRPGRDPHDFGDFHQRCPSLDKVG